jgi:hypothetical protein
VLKLSRTEGQEWLVGPDITITLLETGDGISYRGHVKLKIVSPIAPKSSCGTRVRDGHDWIIEHVRMDRFYIGSHGFRVIRAGSGSAKIEFSIPQDVVVSRGENRWLHEKLIAGTATPDDLAVVKGQRWKAA